MTRRTKISEIIVTCTFCRTDAEKLGRCEDNWILGIQKEFETVGLPRFFTFDPDNLQYFISYPERVRLYHGKENYEVKFGFFVEEIDMLLFETTIDNFLNKLS